MTNNVRYEIAQVRELPLDLKVLVRESEAEGFKFLLRLVAEWESAGNRFSLPGEAFFVATCGGRVVGVAGLNIDPYEETDRMIGRVRHLYIAAAARRRGVGRALLRRVVDQARGSFSQLHLRTDSPAAAAFYESCGFSPTGAPGTFTHRLLLQTAA